MSRKITWPLILLIFSMVTGRAQQAAPKPLDPVPSENQVRWQEMEYYAFLHFSINTFTDQEWGSGAEDPKIFNPDSLDCRQWARVCKEAGMKGIILTAKHHSGFCLWPSKYTDFSVKSCPWKNGKGDIVRELANACKEYGLKLGIYLSPWDRNYAGYGKPGYITYFRNQLRELLTQYGDIFEIWFDGANGGSGYYGGANETRTIDRRTYYDWKNTYKLIRSLQPKIVIWNDGGDRGDLRWVGTEAGNVGETNWSLLDSTGDVTWNMLHYGLETGNAWVPGEVNTSIRPGWFYHAYEDTRVKTLPQLLDIYYSSFGRNGTLLLNFPIDRHGLIHPNDEKATLELAKTVRESFTVNLAEKTKATATNVRGNSGIFAANRATDGKKDTYWATDDGVDTASMVLDFGKPTLFNCFMAQEYIRLGQRVKAFEVEAMVDGIWKELGKGTTIGYRRILRFPAVRATQLRFAVTASKACPVISNIGIYDVPLVLTAPVIRRDRLGEITIYAADSTSVIYCTLDGSVPTTRSQKYTGPLATDGKLEVQAIAVDPSSGKCSPVSSEQFDVPHTHWKIAGTDDDKAAAVIDGDPHTAWHQRGKKMPVDLVLDLGQDLNLAGFRYLPDQDHHTGIITGYQLFVSEDGEQWRMVDEGEFSNIDNNPLWQVRKFPPAKERFIKLRALHNTRGDDDAGYAGIDVITATSHGQELYVGTNYHPHDDKDMVKIGRDIDLMKAAGFKVVRMGHLAWDSYEPSEGHFDLGWFDSVMDLMHKAGIKVVLDIAVRPAPIWLHQKYPSIDIVDAAGDRLYPNHRYMEDVGDPMYQQYAIRYADTLTRRYGGHPALLAFGIDNESGDGPISYSETARGRFIAWLRKKYSTVDSLNKAWATQRWSRRINDLEEVGLPVSGSVRGAPERMLDFRRFVSDEVNGFLFKVIDKVNTNAPHALVNTNAWYYSDMKYFDYSDIAYSGKMTREGCGFYPGLSLTTNWGIMDALFGIARIQFESINPFWCTEFTTMTAVPNSIRKSAYATLMYGNQMVCGWTWQSMYGGEEQYLEGMLDWDGVPNRKYDEYKKIAGEFKKIGRFFPYKVQAEVGLAFSFPSQIASSYFPEQHQNQLQSCFDLFYHRNMDTRIIEVGKSELNYKLLFLPGVAVMDEKTAAKIREYVNNGGTVIMTSNSAVVDATGKVFTSTHPGLLSDVFGIRVGSYEETEVMNEISRKKMKGKKLDLLYKGSDIATESARFDVIEPKGAEVSAMITSLDRDYPVITTHAYGKGRAIYVGLPARGEVLGPLVDDLIQELSIKRGPDVPSGVMARQIDPHHILYLNVSGEPRQIPGKGSSRSILFDRSYTGGFTLAPYEPEFIETR